MGTADRGGFEFPSFTLRPATLNDFQFIQSIRAAGLREYIDQIGIWDDEDQFVRFKARFDPAVYGVIIVNGRDVGAMAVEWRSEEAVLTDLYIRREEQNQGIGAAVVSSVVSEAIQRGVAVKLKVLKPNPARRLYERLGFLLDFETETHYHLCTAPENG